MSTTNLDAFDLKNVNLQGLIHEDVLSRIWDISRIPLPFTERAGSGSHSNQYFSWRMDKLVDPVTDGQLIDGQVVTTEANATKNGRRVGNHSEIRGKRVEVSTRAIKVNTIGYANELANQLTRRQQELRRDVEATAMSNNGSVEGTDTVAGVSAGLSAWLVNDVDVDGNPTSGNVDRGATGADGGWDSNSADSLVAASTPGTPRAITETALRDIVQAIYEKGGTPNTVMTTPQMKRQISNYFFGTAARVADIQAREGDGAGMRTAQGAVDLFVTDFGTVSLVPNRLQPEYATGNDSVFVLDFTYIELSYLHGYQVEPLAKDALSSNRFMSVDWATCIKNWDALGAFQDADPTAAMTL